VSVNFAAVLVSLAALTGLIWLIDALFFAKARARALAAATPGGVASVELPKEPLLVEYSRSFFPVIFIVLVIRSFLAEPFQIPSSSMMPTLLIGDFILVNKFAYGIKLPVIDHKIIEVGEPARGDVVVFRFPRDPSQDYIKRVIGLPGDRITYRDKRIFVNDVEVPAELKGRYLGVGSGRDMTGAELKSEQLGSVAHDILVRPNSMQRGPYEGPLIVPEGQYFVMGDNRDNSEDSRFWGFVPEQNLVGRAFLIWMNWDGKNGGVDFSRLGTGIH